MGEGQDQACQEKKEGKRHDNEPFVHGSISSWNVLSGCRENHRLPKYTRERSQGQSGTVPPKLPIDVIVPGAYLFPGERRNFSTRSGKRGHDRKRGTRSLFQRKGSCPPFPCPISFPVMSRNSARASIGDFGGPPRNAYAGLDGDGAPKTPSTRCLRHFPDFNLRYYPPSPLPIPGGKKVSVSGKVGGGPAGSGVFRSDHQNSGGATRSRYSAKSLENALDYSVHPGAGGIGAHRLPTLLKCGEGLGGTFRP